MTLDELLKKAGADFDGLSKSEQDTLIVFQITSLMKNDMSWPKAKFRWENGVKVYESYEDYCND